MDPKEIGYIKLWRSLFGDPLWHADTGKHNLKSAWIDLLLLANWSDSEYEGQVIKRGQVGRSKQYLAIRWGVDRKTVDKWLAKLKRQGKIFVDSTPHGTLITILKYADYQGLDDVDDAGYGQQNGQGYGQPYGQQDGQQSGHIRRINKNNKEEAKEEKRIIPRFTRDPVEDY